LKSFKNKNIESVTTEIYDATLLKTNGNTFENFQANFLKEMRVSVIHTFQI
jgi:hypothetical protein